MGFGFSFSLFSIMFTIAFLVIISIFVVTAVKGLSQWNKNNHAPKLTVPATVVAKRANVSHHHSTEHHHASTSYYVTFQVESGDRLELHMAGSEYGLLAEGDRGILTFQGTRYLGFERKYI